MSKDKEEEFLLHCSFWRCEECGHEDHLLPMPHDRQRFYAEGKPLKCKRCKSQAMMPVGF